jgi:hypothetical protein
LENVSEARVLARSGLDSDFAARVIMLLFIAERLCRGAADVRCYLFARIFLLTVR